MTWWARLLPFVSRAMHALEVQHRDALIVELQAERDYWRTRAERLMDAALVRAGAVHEPTMVDRPKRTETNVVAAITSAMSMQEIDSSLKQLRKAGS